MHLEALSRSFNLIGEDKAKKNEVKKSIKEDIEPQFSLGLKEKAHSAQSSKSKKKKKTESA